MKIVGLIVFCIVGAIGIAVQWYRYKDTLKAYRPPKNNTDELP